MSYDPRPRRRHKGRPRRGIEPAGLKRWRLAHRLHLDPRTRRRRRSYDPAVRQTRFPRRKAVFRGRRGGAYFRSPFGKMRRRYDPQPRRRFGGIRSYGGKIERGLSSKWGTLLGGGLAALYGVFSGLNDTAGMLGYKMFDGDTLKAYGQQIYGGTFQGHPVQASISNLWKPNAAYGNALNYLCYRFTGYNPQSKTWSQSAWVVPFWASVAGLVASILPLGAKAKRIQKPLKAISTGALIASTIGALALPATTVGQMVSATQRQTRGAITPLYASAQGTGQSSDANNAATSYLASGNQATGGTRRYLIAV